ncbi:hypothetical protein NEDG_01018 [Nematocida displodere]|uniref:Uncharacterized protein n=1 Tax=Nematocida displodere TaxID=1805483 RepID=A0A177ED06_9MICR|nr:hypothetical protein NEDG_01018 [Nematocida displodere]
MSISVSPFYFLLNMGVVVGMCGMFLKYSAHERMSQKKRTLASNVDMSIVGCSVVITSLFVVWSGGGLLASYFGNFSLFQEGGPQVLETLQKTDILIEIGQKVISFLILSLAALQSRKTGDALELNAWGKCMIGVCAILGASFFVLQTVFKGFLGVVVLYLMSSIFDVFVVIFSLLTIILIRKDLPSGKTTAYLPQKIADWNTGVCLVLVCSVMLDFASKVFFIGVEVTGRLHIPLLIDMASMVKCVSTLLLAYTGYSARIPQSKAYSTE